MDKKISGDLIIANKELAFQKKEKDKRAAELIIFTNTKITEGKKDEEYIGHLVAIVESSDDAIISQSLDGTIKSWNKGCEKIFGYTAKQAVGKHISLIIPPDYINEAKKILEGICNTEIIDLYETVRNRKDGTKFYVSLTVSPLKDWMGNIIGVSKIARDITSRKKSEAELIFAYKELAFQNDEKGKRAAELVILSGDLKAQKEELKRANDDLEKRVFERTCELENLNHELKDLSVSKDKFLSVISHDLRNPLTALLLASDELNSHSENNTFDPIQPFIKIIHRTSHNILQQLNELVDWAKMQQEKTTLRSCLS